MTIMNNTQGQIIGWSAAILAVAGMVFGIIFMTKQIMKIASEPADEFKVTNDQVLDGGLRMRRIDVRGTSSLCYTAENDRGVSIHCK